MPEQETRPEPPEVDTLRKELQRICVDTGGYPDAWPRHTSCQACGEKVLVPSFTKMGFTHSRCTSCHFVCVNPYPPEKVLQALYEGEYYTKTRLLFEQPRLRDSGLATPFSAPVNDLKVVVARASKGKSEGSWLDVGGGLGAFAGLVQENLPGWKVGLSELNKASVAIARELFDFDIVTSSPEELKKGNERFDVISSVAVAEHIPDPLAFLQSYFDLVKPGGCLVTVIPHFSLLNVFVSKGSSANAAPPYHTSLFNEEAFRRMLNRLDGLKTCRIEQAGPPAFEMIHIADFGDHWDVSIPTEENPTPRSLQIKPYDEETGQKLAVLSKIGPHLGEALSRLDGKQLLIGYCWRSLNPDAKKKLSAQAAARQAKIEASHQKFVHRQKEQMRLAAEQAAAEQARLDAEHQKFVRRQQEQMRLASEAAALKQERMEAEHAEFVRQQEELMRPAREAAAAEQARIEAEHREFVRNQEEKTRQIAEAARAEQARIDAEHNEFVRNQEEKTRQIAEAARAEQARIDAEHTEFVRKQQEDMRLAAEAAALEQVRIRNEHEEFVRQQVENTRKIAETAAAEQARIEAEHREFVRKQQEEMNPAVEAAAAEQVRIDAEHKVFVHKQQEEMRLASEAAAREQARLEAEHAALVRKQQEEMNPAVEAAAAEQVRIDAEHKAFVHKQQEEMRLASEAAAREQARLEAEHAALVRKQQEEMRLATEASAAAQARIDAEHAAFVARQKQEARATKKT